MPDTDILAGRWQNERVTNAFDTLMGIVEALAERLLSDGFLGGYQPLTLRDLQAMDPAEVDAQLTAMIDDPQTRREGLSLLARYAEWVQREEARDGR